MIIVVSQLQYIKTVTKHTMVFVDCFIPKLVKLKSIKDLSPPPNIQLHLSNKLLVYR